MENLEQHLLDTIIKSFNKLKVKGESSFTQISDEKDLFWLSHNDGNSIAILIRHLTGNMLSRWTNIFEEDGEKLSRDRPAEFDLSILNTKSELLQIWEEGWGCLFKTLNQLNGDDLQRIIYIRQEPHTVIEAIFRQLSHYAVHIGQITLLAKMRTPSWKSLSIPRDKKIYDYRELTRK